jgi:hypothetical protein
MNESTFKQILEEALYNFSLENEVEEEPPLVEDMVDFQQAGLLTRDTGLVVSLSDNSEFHITIQKTK